VPSRVEVRPARSWLPKSLIPRGVNGIRKRGRLRVGYLPDNLPFAYQNKQGELVGLDIELAHRLAEDLGVGLSFIPVQDAEMDEMLESRKVDIAMAGIPLSVLTSADAALTVPYLETTMAFIVDDHEREQFATWKAMAGLPSLRIAVVADHYFRSKLERAFPNAEVIELESARDFFEGSSKKADALLYTAEAGATWTLLYPAYSVVIPRPRTPTMPLAFAVDREDTELRAFLDRWIELSKGTGVIQRAYDHWFLGEDAVEKKPRWSILRNVLQWTK
jgi:ABC-type amino acid transport substrate-binding protein